jgi:hypothetical protein
LPTGRFPLSFPPSAAFFFRAQAVVSRRGHCRRQIRIDLPPAVRLVLRQPLPEAIDFAAQTLHRLLIGSPQPVQGVEEIEYLFHRQTPGLRIDSGLPHIDNCWTQTRTHAFMVVLPSTCRCASLKEKREGRSQCHF